MGGVGGQSGSRPTSDLTPHSTSNNSILSGQRAIRSLVVTCCPPPPFAGKARTSNAQTPSRQGSNPKTTRLTLPTGRPQPPNRRARPPNRQGGGGGGGGGSNPQPAKLKPSTGRAQTPPQPAGLGLPPNRQGPPNRHGSTPQPAELNLPPTPPHRPPPNSSGVCGERNVGLWVMGWWVGGFAVAAPLHIWAQTNTTKINSPPPPPSSTTNHHHHPIPVVFV